MRPHNLIPWRLAVPSRAAIVTDIGRPHLAAVLLGALLVLSGCGTRVSRPADAAALQSVSPAAAGSEAVTIDSSSSRSSPAETAVAPAPPTTDVQPSGASRGGTQPVAGKAPTTTGSSVAAPGTSSARPHASGSVAPPTNKPETSGTPSPPIAPGPAGGAKAPIVLGQPGTFSGPAAAGLVGSIAGIQAWARTVNDRGGIDGHPVKVITVDDGGDRARAVANVKDLVERQGVSALIAEYAPITRSAYGQYLIDERIPVVGGDGATTEWASNPMYFLVGSNGHTTIAGTAYELAKTGKKKAAFLYCAEVPDCRTATGWFKDGAKDTGVDVVYEAQVSLAQPDFTAECLQAKNRGVEAIGLAADPNTIQRIAASCKRQGFQPLYLASHSMQTAGMAKFSGIEGGLLGAQPQMPWFVTSGTPAIGEYATAIKNMRRASVPART